MIFNKNYPELRKGFTIVEILIAIAILVIIAGIVMSGFQDYQKHQWYQVVVNDVRNELNQARAKTIGSVDGEVYGIYVGTSTVEFFSGAIPTVGDPNNTIISFSRGIYATSSITGGNWYLTFSRLTGTPTATGTIDIIDSTRAATTTLSILETGVIQ